MNTSSSEVSIEGDERGFIKRTCQTCQRDFLTRVLRQDVLVLLRMLSTEIFWGNDSEWSSVECRLRCVYCRRSCRLEQFVSTDLRRFIKVWENRWTENLRHLALSTIYQSLSQNPRPTFLLCSPAPVTLVYREVLDDAFCLFNECCGECFGGVSSWPHALYCPWCGKSCEDAEKVPSKGVGRYNQAALA